MMVMMIPMVRDGIMSMSMSVMVTMVHLLVYRGMVGHSLIHYLSLESSLRVDHVVDRSEDTVRLEDGVRPLGHLAIPVLVGSFVVPGMLVVNAIAVLVLGVGVVVVVSVVMSMGVAVMSTVFGNGDPGN